jgi:hypothetical protein
MSSPSGHRPEYAKLSGTGIIPKQCPMVRVERGETGHTSSIVVQKADLMVGAEGARSSVEKAVMAVLADGTASTLT